jgi:diguanylate cyclase (GGDEF)-like protein
MSDKFLSFFHSIDWSRRDIKDAVVIFGVAIAAYFATALTDLFDKTFHWAKEHQSWGIDNLFMVSFVIGLAMIVYSYRRLEDLSQEIAARRLAEEEARKLARHDPLTGLANRRFFAEKLDEMLRSVNERSRVAVLMLDLDGFKAINDVHGHAVGDKALIEFAERITAILPPGSVVARVGGDEFAMIHPKIGSLDDPAAFARRLIAAVAEPFVIDEISATIGVGVGIAVAPDNGTEREELVRRADLALYRAKAEGRSLIRFFESEMDQHVERRAQLERELREALAHNQIDVHYQPLVDLDGDRIVGFEALARWNSPSLGPITPSVFIALAEECNLIHELGEQLLRVACREARNWPSNVTLSFNVSPLQLRDRALGLRILAILGETGLPPQRLELEVTESALVSEAETAQKVIDDLRSVGVRIALDDFGTGYATMSQLLSLRFDKIKINRSFVNRLGKDPQSDVIVRATIGLAKGLGLTTTAEGVEEGDQLETLKASGCLQGQGYLFGHAVPAEEIPALLGTGRRVSAVA